MIPHEVEKLLYDHFEYPKLIIAQVATLSVNGTDIRSMGLSDIDDEGRMIFLTNRGSHKWAQLSIHPAISILLLNLKQNVQIIARGQAELLTLESHSSLLEHYWLCTPRQAQFTFLHKHPEGEFIPLKGSLEITTPPENFGMIRVVPANWEILVIDSDNYHASPRFRFEKNDSNWHKTRLNAI
jgi:pyridoxine/pyridoxamine 5'-phosphate oxidase